MISLLIFLDFIQMRAFLKCSLLSSFRGSLLQPLFSKCFASLFVRTMCSKALKQSDLEEMTKEQLISKVLHYQGLYRQVINQKVEDSKSSKIIKPISKTKKGKVKCVNFKECKYRRIALKFAYLGWDYSGLQRNPNLEDTIEHILQNALYRTKLIPEDDPMKISRCGRTDKGVSAFQQVITVRVRTQLTSGAGVSAWVDPARLPVDDRIEVFNENSINSNCSAESSVKTIVTDEYTDDLCQSEKEISKDTEGLHSCNPSVVDEDEFDYVLMINRALPPEIRIVAWAPIYDESFSARHNCTGREYRYFFPRGKLDIKAMNDAAKLFCGEHDFRNFGKTNVINSTNFVRNILEFEIKESIESDDVLSTEQPYNMCHARIMGSGFVYHQVRNMMAVLYLIGAGYEQASVISELLDVEKVNCRPSFGISEAYPLVLYKTFFNDLNWKISKTALTLLLRHFQSYWSCLSTKAAMTRSLIKCIENDTSVSILETNSSKDENAPKVNPASYSSHGVHSNSAVAKLGSRPGKTYKRIMDRPAGLSIEDKLENLMKKRQRLNLDVDKKHSTM